MPERRLMRYLLGVLMFFGMVGCELPVKHAEDLHGEYQAYYYPIKKPGVTAHLVLLPDGRFLQEMTLENTGEIITRQGNWKYSPRSGFVSVDENYLNATDAEGRLIADFQHQEPSGGALGAVRWLGQIRIGSDEHVEYRRIGPIPSNLNLGSHAYSEAGQSR